MNTVLSQLERDPGEFIVDPWVAVRATLVAEQRGRVVAAAHLLRYGAGEEVGEAMRGAGEINWLLYWPRPATGRTRAAADALMTACLAQLRRWQVIRWDADGTLPAPGVYGLPSSGPTSAPCTSGRASPTSATPRWCCWPGSTTCHGRPGRPSPSWS